MALVAGAAGLIAAAPNASADIVGMVVVSRNTETNSAFLKRLEVPCGDGMRALGGDISISGSNQVRIAEIFPLTSSVRFAAVEPVEGVSANWSYTARAVCAPLSSLPGYQRITVTDQQLVLEGGATGRVSTRDAGSAAFCPTGKSLVGFGGSADAGPFPFVDDVNMPRVRLTRIQPQLSLRPPGQDISEGEGVPRGFRVDANGGGYDGDLRVQGAGICVDADQVTVDESVALSRSDSVNSKSISEGCDNGTDSLITGGFSVFSEADDSEFEVGVTALAVNRLLSSATSIARESATGTSGNWLVGVYVVCTT